MNSGTLLSIVRSVLIRLCAQTPKTTASRYSRAGLLLCAAVVPWFRSLSPASICPGAALAQNRSIVVELLAQGKELATRDGSIVHKQGPAWVEGALAQLTLHDLPQAGEVRAVRDWYSASRWYDGIELDELRRVIAILEGSKEGLIQDLLTQARKHLSAADVQHIGPSWVASAIDQLQAADSSHARTLSQVRDWYSSQAWYEGLERDELALVIAALEAPTPREILGTLRAEAIAMLRDPVCDKEAPAWLRYSLAMVRNSENAVLSSSSEARGIAAASDWYNSTPWFSGAERDAVEKVLIAIESYNDEAHGRRVLIQRIVDNGDFMLRDGIGLLSKGVALVWGKWAVALLADKDPSIAERLRGQITWYSQQDWNPEVEGDLLRKLLGILGWKPSDMPEPDMRRAAKAAAIVVDSTVHGTIENIAYGNHNDATWKVEVRGLRTGEDVRVHFARSRSGAEYAYEIWSDGRKAGKQYAVCNPDFVHKTGPIEATFFEPGADAFEFYISVDYKPKRNDPAWAVAQRVAGHMTDDKKRGSVSFAPDAVVEIWITPNNRKSYRGWLAEDLWPSIRNVDLTDKDQQSPSPRNSGVEPLPPRDKSLSVLVGGLVRVVCGSDEKLEIRRGSELRPERNTDVGYYSVTRGTVLTVSHGGHDLFIRKWLPTKGWEASWYHVAVYQAEADYPYKL